MGKPAARHGQEHRRSPQPREVQNSREQEEGGAMSPRCTGTTPKPKSGHRARMSNLILEASTPASLPRAISGGA